MKLTARALTPLALASIAAGVCGCGTPHINLPSAYVYDTAITVATPAVVNIDPVTARTYGDHLYDEMVYQTLLGISPQGTATPELARSWHHNADATKWTFTLNPYAKWWTGRPVTASNVVWTFQFYRQTGSGFVHSDELRNVVNVTAQSATTFTLSLKHSDPDFGVNVLTPSGGIWILPSFLLARLPLRQVSHSEYLNQLKDAVGSGPFRPLRESSDTITWAAYPHYYLGTPRTKYLRWTWSKPLNSGTGGRPLDVAWSDWPVRTFGSSYRRTVLVSPWLWGLTAAKPGVPWPGIVKAATNRDQLSGKVAALGDWKIPVPGASLDSILRNLGNQKLGRRWVGPGGALFSISLAGPDTPYSHHLQYQLASQWRSRGMAVTLSGHSSSADLVLSPVMMRPHAEKLPDNIIPLVQSHQYWYIHQGITDFVPNPWDPFYKAEAWRVLRRHKS